MLRDYGAYAAFLAERAAMPFAWGSDANDCASFAALAVAAQTGRNPLDGLVWSNEDEAYAFIEREGGLVTAVSARLRQIIPAAAHRGDVAGVMTGNQLGLMIVDGPLLLGPGIRRMMRRPRAETVLAWSAA